MSDTRTQGPSEVEWELHREELTRLYMTPKITLEKVMTLMREKHRKNQYEKYLRHKWRLNKNTTSQIWKAIAPIVYDFERRGRQYEVLIHNDKKTLRTIQKETRRYVSRGDNPLIDVALDGLPQGVVIREIQPSKQPEIVVDIPSLSLGQYLDTRLSTPEARCTLGLTPSSTTTQATALNQLNFNPESFKALQAVALNAFDSGRSSSSSPGTTPGYNVFSPLYHREMLFSLVNNFAGLSVLDFEKVGGLFQHEVLQHGLRKAILIPNCFKSQDFALRAIAKQLFKASIRNGRTDIVRFLLGHPALGIEPNRQSQPHHIPGYDRLAPLYIAVEAQQKDVVRVLLENGADPSMCYHGRAWINHVLFGFRDRDPELINLFIKHGARFDDTIFRQLIRAKRTERIVAEILSRDAAQKHEEWKRKAILHDIFQYQDHEIQEQTLRIMCQYNIDLNWRKDDEAKKTIKNDGFRTRGLDAELMTDIAIDRGNLVMLQLLVTEGARVSHHTLLRAKKSRDEPLIRWSLGQTISIVHEYKLWDIVMAEAIRTKSDQIIQLISLQCLDTTQFSYDTIRVAATEGYWDLFHQFCQSRLRFRVAERSQTGSVFKLMNTDHRLPILYSAMRDGKDKIVEEVLDAVNLLDQGDHPTIKQALLYALRRHDTRMVTSILGTGISLSYEFSSTEHHDTPFGLAVEWGNPLIIKSIIDTDMDINGYQAHRTLNAAIERKDKGTVDMLLDYGVFINHPHDMSGEIPTALESAILSKDRDMIEYVLQMGADPHDSAALARAVHHDSEILQLLLGKHALVYPRCFRGWGGDALIDSITACDLKSFKKMLQVGADANERISCDRSLRRWTESGKNPDSGVVIKDDLNSTSSWAGSKRYISAFGYAISQSATTGTEFVDHLLQLKQRTGCSPEALVAHGSNKRSEVQTAFLAAIECAEVSVIDILIRHLAEINHPANMRIKRTPLQQAVERGDLEIAELLLRHGADVNGPAAHSKGATALQIAAIKGYNRIILLLLERGADVHTPASRFDGRSPLEGAAEHGRLDTVALLLQHYGKYEAKYEKEFIRAIEYAEENDFGYIADFLRQHQANSDSFFNEFMDFGSWESEENMSGI